ncbi:Protein of unknown function [Bacillus mycoides]|uniref:Uncharacterized protein n=1 Tax=Bacillus mycoides TaxID=1405 RepID=A0A1G4EJK8_BACMY|nr:Protein of unknown function [Bacillus mycoides]
MVYNIWLSLEELSYDFSCVDLK